MAAAARRLLACVCAVIFGNRVALGGLVHRRLSAEVDVELSSFSATVVRQMEHPDKPFTQGLEWSPDEQYLIETSGAYPEGTMSYFRKVDPTTGNTLGNPWTDGMVGKDGKAMFVEGIAELNNKWFASTWNSKVTAEYDSAWNFVAWHPYPSLGWGLAHSPDKKSFLATNGSEWMMTIDPTTFQVTGTTQVTCFGKKLAGLNELEMVRNFQGKGKDVLFGNLYLTRLVVGVDPATGQCVSVFDLDGLDMDGSSGEGSGFHVANGIAYRKSTGTFTVTGKNWANMFEVRLEDDGGDARLKLEQKLTSAMMLDVGPL